ncbi:ABC transporter ATP-binding protein [Acidisoma silvae]|uniref:ABC transporter ATP-binding protein n=1 Tax=Acidisoma silvae TaxID=2802396 RepID=A0A963YVA1_9PROT|nr:ABC transporter ATP-binding protein [Acidisoma silvae]MCB8877761.1 ABC transporter ATP-binding protein [Acidisoma silvae]
MNLLTVENLRTGYGPVTVNRDVSITVDAAEIVTVLGPNGAGKSTLLRAISGLLKPRAGRISFDGEDVTNLPADRAVSRGIVMVPEGRRIFVDMTVQENLRLGAYGRRDRDKVEADLRRMEAYFEILAQKRQQKGGELSGGQQQMLAIARGLMARPRILLLDEPSLGLSPKLVKDLRGVILDVKATFNAAVLLVEQNAGLAMSVAARGYLLHHGRFVASGPIENLRDDQMMRDLYLGAAQKVA